MTRAVLIVPGSLETRTGGYEYDRRIVAGLRKRGWSIDVRELDASFPHPTADALDHAAGVLAEIPAGTLVLVDGLALGAMPDQVEHEARRLSIVPIVHALLASEVGLAADAAGRLAASERRALAAARLIIVVGRTLIDGLANYAVPADRIAVVEPGTDPAPVARGSQQANVVHMVTVATLNPGKGHELLIRALTTMPQQGWRLTCAGSTTRHPATAATVRSLLQANGLEDRVLLAGDLDASAIAALYDSADLFVLPTLSETHPLSVAEALARGLPVVSTTVGAIPDLVGPDAGLLVAPGDVDALAHAVSRVVADPDLRARLAEGARQVRDRLPTWDTAVDRMEDALRNADCGSRIAD